MKVQHLQVCHMCRRVCDGAEKYERWVTRQAYRQRTGIDLNSCLITLTHSYCPQCAQFVANYREAA